MIDSKILQFLALAAFLLHCSEAYYPDGQQHYGSHYGGYNNQNGNFNRYNNNNNNIQSNSNNNNHIHNNSNDRHNAPQTSNNPLLAINLPKIFLGDFEYVPTRDGYRFSYQLIDGTRRTEVGYIPNSGGSSIYKSDERATAERTALRMRARGNAKNRKLSPKSLQSLAG
ncbi:putative uncharacterized transmembrane protein DDB_G0292500 [Rhagoletis pomonella]|uniref:putative uncharacterized transmembrane protein DDB_G0292500 n=1 Tax=Rhagoletis pomonella TaxID=28610 RepID=UPI00177E73E4|nr:putative uncharacterized transmembrane protein DDB_G0292500 [Rhagoletis pomonella]